jgi:hypothetical protein
MKRVSSAFLVLAFFLVMAEQWFAFGQLTFTEFPASDSQQSQRDKLLDEMSKEPTIWKKNEGSRAAWLERGIKVLNAVHGTRAKLLRECDTQEIQGLPLESLVQKISFDLDVRISIDTRSLSSEGIDPQSPIMDSDFGDAQNLFRRVLAPLGLTHVIHEGWVEITTKRKSLAYPTLKTYDLAHVTTKPINLKSIVYAIETMVEPQEWDRNGEGRSRICIVGSLLIASATEQAHMGIESLLATIASGEPELFLDRQSNQ